MNLDQLIDKCREDQIEKLLTISAEPSDLPWVLETANKYTEVYGALGVHPHDAVNCLDEHFDFVSSNCNEDKIVAIGEIGLDYHYMYSPKEVQQKVFKSFLKLAQQKAMPVVIHSREAEEDTIEILKEYSKNLSGVVHCFTGSLDFSKSLLESHPGLYLGFTGVISFKSAEEVREVVRQTPLERILIETDSPFMAPVPYRGKTCVPSYVQEVAKHIALIKNLDLNNVMEVTNKNSQLFFNKEKMAYAH